MRTATHAFNLDEAQIRQIQLDQQASGTGGFGKQVLGETWVNHHGNHGKQSTRGMIAPGQESNPILRGIKDGDIWGPTDVYGSTCRCPATASRWCSARCWRA